MILQLLETGRCENHAKINFIEHKENVTNIHNSKYIKVCATSNAAYKLNLYICNLKARIQNGIT